MKTYFKKKECEECGFHYDATLDQCPHCATRAADFQETKRFAHHVHISWGKQLTCFLLGWAGFQLIGFIVEIAAMLIYMAVNQGSMSGEQLSEATTKFLSGAGGLCLINSVSYLVLFGILFAVNARKTKEFFKPFANWRSYVFGLVGFVALLSASYLWGIIEVLIDPSIGENQNQSVIIEIMAQYPWVGLIVFGMFGPICEEITYRVGLFSFLSRWSKIAAYAFTILIFGAIHFGWSTCFADPSQWGPELLAFPDYLLAGAILCFLYDRVGFGASVMAHMTYNLFACGILLVR